MPVTTISEENKQPEINKEALYLVDFARIESVESLVLITPNNPVPQQPKADALRLPKLKVVKDGK